MSVFAIRHGETAWSLSGQHTGTTHIPGAGQHFLLDTGTLCVLGYYREIPAVKTWNGPLVG